MEGYKIEIIIYYQTTKENSERLTYSGYYYLQNILTTLKAQFTQLRQSCGDQSRYLYFYNQQINFSDLRGDISSKAALISSTSKFIKTIRGVSTAPVVAPLHCVTAGPVNLPGNIRESYT